MFLSNQDSEPSLPALEFAEENVAQGLDTSTELLPAGVLMLPQSTARGSYESKEGWYGEESTGVMKNTAGELSNAFVNKSAATMNKWTEWQGAIHWEEALPETYLVKDGRVVLTEGPKFDLMPAREGESPDEGRPVTFRLPKYLHTAFRDLLYPNAKRGDGRSHAVMRTEMAQGDVPMNPALLSEIKRQMDEGVYDASAWVKGGGAPDGTLGFSLSDLSDSDVPEGFGLGDGFSVEGVVATQRPPSMREVIVALCHTYARHHELFISGAIEGSGMESFREAMRFDLPTAGDYDSDSDQIKHVTLQSPTRVHRAYGQAVRFHGEKLSATFAALIATFLQSEGIDVDALAPDMSK